MGPDYLVFDFTKVPSHNAIVGLSDGIFVHQTMRFEALHQDREMVWNLAHAITKLDFHVAQLLSAHCGRRRAAPSFPKKKFEPPRSIEKPRASTMSSWPFGKLSSSTSNSD